MTGGFAPRLTGRRATRDRGRRDAAERSDLNCGILKSQYSHRIHAANVYSYFTIVQVIRIMEN